MKTKALCIVAHPDDETIWMGGTILRNKELDWTVLSLCRKTDRDRAPKFKKVCQKLKAKPIISDLDDEENPLSQKEIEEKILSSLPEKKFDIIYTHGKNGEYGHIRHKQIHKAVKKLIHKKKLKSKKLYFFSYIKGIQSSPQDEGMMIPIANPKAGLITDLSLEEFKLKFSLITDAYGFQHPNFETLSCGKKEAFNLYKG